MINSTWHIPPCHYLFSKNWVNNVEPPSAAVSWSDRSQSLSWLWRNLGPLFFPALLQLIEVCSIGLCTALWRSHHSISVRLRSGLWQDHCNTLILFFFTHSVVDLLLCLGSLSCWWASFSPALAAGQMASHLTQRFGLPLHFIFCCDTPLPLFSSRSFPLHFDETSLFAGDEKEAAKLKVSNHH